MPRFTTAVAVLLAFELTAAAQVPPLTTTPGPGGVPIAPGAPVKGFTPGGIGIGGTEIAPGSAARSEPMYRTAPGGEPVLVTPPRARAARRGGAGATAAGACAGNACAPEGLRFTVMASEDATMPEAIASLAALRAALRACWTPPDIGDRNTGGLEMSVRFGLRRSGALMAPPFVTYATKTASAERRRTLQRSITAAFERCAPFRFAPEFAAGAAGRPFSVRFVAGRAP